MIPAVQRGAVERFRGAIARRLGLYFEDAKLGFLSEILHRKTEARSVDCEIYLADLENGAAMREWFALAEELTVGETYFFRNIDQFRAFAKACLPERVHARAGRRKLTLLSAGCASGEEAYTLAIGVREHLPDPAWEVTILGVDVNPAALERAAKARYSEWALRETPPEIRSRWFRQTGREFQLDDTIQRCVKFEARNLVDDDIELWRPARYDVVFCRNVMMYFTPGQMQALIDRISRSLAPGGYLFLGHAETLHRLSQDFHLRHTHETFYYQRREDNDPHARPPCPPTAPSALAAAVPLVAAVDDSDSWVEAIRTASERIQALAESPFRRAAMPAAALAQQPDLGAVFDLLRQERFAEAFEQIRALAPEASRDPDVLLLHAVLLAHRGRLSEAEEWCGKLLELDELNAGAHYVFSLCREGAGDRKGALHHDQVAAYLDPGFAMPHLHLGLLARKCGDRDAARGELELALSLLQREDPSRLLLFGGGFGRDSLIELCRAELAAIGARP
ncbi:MAG: hypothetical protein A3I02_06510 [Betaproteobacteria bacterium RIFCSPLOWO2_02_FULL_67_26]|nr:MAG: hypothetical protein A3I02_06510 [Betaproteobacteria bacterium RIFCSPLOWO2_02_FULL_67_26]